MGAIDNPDTGMFKNGDNDLVRIVSGRHPCR
jgi:hypothetical protein